MAYLNKQQVVDALKNKPSNITDIDVINSLVAQGHTLEGYNPPKEQQKTGFGKKVLQFGAGILKSGLETALRAGTQRVTSQLGVSPTTLANLKVPEKVDLPVIGETSVRYSDQPGEKIKQMASDVLNVLPGGKQTKTALQLAEVGSKGFAGKLVKSAFKITENDLKKNPDLVKDFLVERISGTKKGITSRAQTAINLAEDELTNLISTAKDKFIKTNDIVKSVEPLMKLYKNSALSSKGVDTIKTAITDFRKTFGDKISVQQAQDFKRNTYQLLRKEYGKLSGAEVETAKQITRGIKEGIEKAFPDVKVADINKKIAIFSKARDLMERQINKAGRNELIGLKDVALTGVSGSVWPTMARLAVESVPFKTYVAKILTSTKTQAAKNAIKKLGPAISELMNIDQQATK